METARTAALKSLRGGAAGVGHRCSLVGGVAGQHDAHAVAVGHHPRLDGRHRARGRGGRAEQFGARGEAADGLEVADGREDDLDVARPVTGEGVLGVIQISAMVSPASCAAICPGGAAATKNRVS